MNEIAIIGAGGFVGAALVETLLLDGADRVRAVVRAYRSLASLARFGPAVAIRVADAENAHTLTDAIRGCSVVVNLTTGVPSGIIRSTTAIHEACVRARVKRLVHLSSAVVFGEVDSPNTADDSDPITKHWMPYARAKAASEIFLRNVRDSSPVEIALLRPGIVWGPRSPHTLGIVESLLGKSAFLVDEGAGIFNSIFIDNLISCIQLCCSAGDDIRGFYNVADSEHLTWRDFYSALAPHLDCDVARIARIPSSHFPWSVGAAIDYLQSLSLINTTYHRFKAHIPISVKARLKSALGGKLSYHRQAMDYQPAPYLDRELWHLQRTRHKLPTAKFAHRFSAQPPVSFDEGILRTIKWFSHIGLVADEPCYAR